MKTNILYVVLSAFILFSTLLVTSCKDDAPGATEANMKRLSAHYWKLVRVTVDGVDKTALFEGLELQWNKDKTFNVTDGGVIWPSNGTWSFTDESGKALLVSLNDAGDVEVTIETLTDTMLVISLHWNKTTLGSGRVSSIAGDHIFEFEAAE